MSKWQFYDCVDGCGEIVYAHFPSRCTKCSEKYWRERNKLRKKIINAVCDFKEKNPHKILPKKEIADELGTTISMVKYTIEHGYHEC